MTEKGILFKSEMMRANLGHHKTVTRRPLEPQPPRDVIMKEHSEIPGYWIPYTKDGRLANNVQGSRKDDCGWYARYRVGDILYCRECWCKSESGVIYRADEVPGSIGQKLRIERGDKWKPSIHMPHAWTRCKMKVIKVGVEPLNVITPQEIMKEGINPDWNYIGTMDIPYPAKLLHDFMDRWDRAYGKGRKCEDNPWVWVIEYQYPKLPDCKERSDGVSCNLIYPDSSHCEIAMVQGICPEHKEIVW